MEWYLNKTYLFLLLQKWRGNKHATKSLLICSLLYFNIFFVRKHKDFKLRRVKIWL